MKRRTATRLGPLARLRHAFVTGLFITLPLIITVWLLGILLHLVESISTPLMLGLLRLTFPELAADPAIVRWVLPVAGVLATAGLVLAVGRSEEHTSELQSLR